MHKLNIPDFQLTLESYHNPSNSIGYVPLCIVQMVVVFTCLHAGSISTERVGQGAGRLG